MRLKNRRIVITGAGSGIGQCTGELFRREGANVAWLDLNGPAVEALARQHGGVGIQVDVSDEASVAAAVAAAAQALGGIDGLVNSAGVADGTQLEDTDLATWRRILDINLTGTFLMCRAVVPWLRKEASATIVNLASAQALSPSGISPAYAASKGGVLTFSKDISVKLAPKIRVNVVCPGVTETPMTFNVNVADPALLMKSIVANMPLGRAGKPIDQANAILFLTSDESSYISGASLAPDGGRTKH